MKIHLLSGFLGSGKTTAIQHACRILLQEGVKVGVITNDQGIKLVDGDFFKSLNIPGRQVINGCFCCNYNDLDSSIQSLIATNQTDVIFAESVGSCTDIVATVMKPLLQFRPESQVTVSIFADSRLLLMLVGGNANGFDESVNYIYHKQLEEAGIIVINKIDLISDVQRAYMKHSMQEKYGSKILLYQNSFDEGSIQQWLHVLNNYQPAQTLQSLEIDYDIYGTGEAKLAWLDQELEVYSVDNNALEEMVSLVHSIYNKIKEHEYPIGHLKFLLNGNIKISYTATSQPEINSDPKKEKAKSGKLLINARVQTEPKILAQVISDAIKEEEALSGCTIVVASLSAFQPGYPHPTYRM